MGSTTARDEVWTRAGLGSRERRLVAIACVGFACTAEPIVAEVRAALDGGEFIIDEMFEIMLHFAVYCD